MIRDWDLWPIYLDQRWVDAESAKRLAKIASRVAAFISAYGISVAEAGARFRAAHKAYGITPKAHQPALSDGATARKCP
jgi:hypothetical protein